MFERIVVAVDGSEPAKHALSVACDLANKYGSDIHLVHSPQLETTGIAVGSGAVEIKPAADKIAAAGRSVIEQAEQVAKLAGCTTAESVIGTDDPAKDILNTIDNVGADLVVMGRRGLGGITSLLMQRFAESQSRGDLYLHDSHLAPA